MKIKIIQEYDTKKLEELINEFISTDIEIKDIKITSSVLRLHDGVTGYVKIRDLATIAYE
jgi:DNA-binding protein